MDSYGYVLFHGKTKASIDVGMRGSFELLLRISGTSEMIEQYATRQLTKASDKVMAIVGVPALIQQHAKLTFVAAR